MNLQTSNLRPRHQRTERATYPSFWHQGHCFGVLLVKVQIDPHIAPRGNLLLAHHLRLIHGDLAESRLNAAEARKLDHGRRPKIGSPEWCIRLYTVYIMLFGVYGTFAILGISDHHVGSCARRSNDPNTEGLRSAAPKTKQRKISRTSSQGVIPYFVLGLLPPGPRMQKPLQTLYTCQYHVEVYSYFEYMIL